MASSWTERLLTLKVGARRILQSNGLKAASPWVRSIARVKKFVEKYWFGRPKKFCSNGLAVLSNGVVAVGIWRNSWNERTNPVISRKRCWPAIGKSPLKTFWLKG